MNTKEDLQKKLHNESQANPLSDAVKSFLTVNIGRKLRKLLYFFSLALFSLMFSGCAAGYIASEPAYMEYDRPMRPSELSIWIDGDWRWNNQSHLYVQQAGYWDSPRHGQRHVAGYWNQTPKGKSWTKSHWQSDERQNDNHGKNSHKNNNRRR